jgi:hypothetical protein
MDVRALEATIRRLPGVEAVRVVMNASNPVEVHILAHPGKPAKQIVRDVQSLALAAYNLTIDRRIVSVVQLEGADAVGGDRVVVEDVTETVDGSRMTIAVSLKWQDKMLVGEAQGPAASSTRLRLVAEATVSALQQVLTDRAAVAVAAADTPTVGGRAVAIAQVVIVSEGVERVVVGSALVGADPSRAMVRAVLDALNRLVPELRR